MQTIDREKIARKLSAARPAGAPPLDVCIEVNAGGEASKSGVAPAEAVTLGVTVAGLPGLRLRGIMGIPEPTPDTALRRSRFRVLRDCFDACLAAGLAVDTLSMGMSADLEDAIAEGATLVRVGTAIFGTREGAESVTMATTFIGGGNMATALIGGMLARGAAVTDFRVVEPFPEARARLAARFAGIALHDACTREAIAGAALVVLAVKPQQMREAAGGSRAASGPRAGRR